MTEGSAGDHCKIFQIAHRNLCHTFCVPEHAFEDVEEIISGDVLWYDT